MVFITATDTEVGKTVVAGAIAGVFRELGYNVGYISVAKWACCIKPEGDAARLKVLSGVPTQEMKFALILLKNHLLETCHERAGRVVKLKEITDYYNELLKEFNSLFVEGAGGLAVPYTEDALVIDFAKELRLPLIVVARPTLGTVNHTVLTIAYAKAHGLTVAGVIYQVAKECEMERVQENKEMIEELSGVPVLGLLPFFEGEFTKEVLESAKEYIMISKLEEFIQNESNVAGAPSI